MKTARHGFTLVELMVALAAGSFAIAGVYYLGNLSARAYSEQMMVSDTQMAVRTAMEQLRRDFGRAGFMGSRNTNSAAEHYLCDGDPNSVAMGATIQGVNVTPNGSMVAGVRTAIDDTTNTTRGDLVTVWGNYATSDSYMMRPTGVDDEIAFETTRESFRRSFVDPGVGGASPEYNPDRFQAAFLGRWVRVENRGRYWYRRVADVRFGAAKDDNPTDDTVLLADALPNSGACYTSEAGNVVSPISRVTYKLDTITAGGPLARLMTANVAGSNRAVLQRTEERIEDGTADATTTRLVLDYAVEFAVDAIYNTAAAGATPDFALATDTSATTVDTVSANFPEQFRALRVTLSARAPDANPRLPSIARPDLNTPFMIASVPVAGAADGTFRAAVRTMRAEIFLPNMMAAPR